MRVVIDTDPAMGVLGGDPEDAFALLLALNSPELEVLGITVVNGNVPVDLGYSNARRLLELADRASVPLAAGPPGPLMPFRDQQTAWQAQKRELPRLVPSAAPPSPSSAPELLARGVLDSDQSVTLVAIGPLTNLALAAILEPAVVEAVERVVIMGGTGRGPGNVTPAAEFNLWCDPEAAAVVFAAGWPITLLTLDICHQVRLARSRLAGSIDSDSALARHVWESCAPWFDALEANGEDGIPMFDSLTVGTLLDDQIVTTRPALVEIDTTRGPAQGASVIHWDTDSLGHPLSHTNADVSVAVDADRYLDLFDDRVLKQLR